MRRVTRCCLLPAVILAVVAASCSTEPPDEAAVPSEFVGDAEAVDVGGATVTWTVACGSRAGDELTTDVSDALFEYETNAADPAAGQVRQVAFHEWADMAENGGPWVVRGSEGATRTVVSSSAPADHDPCAA